MADERDKLNKVLSLALHPTTVSAEAIAAFNRARELVKQNPVLAHAPEEPKVAPTPPAPKIKGTARITQIHSDWLLIFVENISKKAYELDMSLSVDFDFNELPVAVNLQYRGSSESCEALEEFLRWLIGYINTKVSEKK